MSKTLTFKNNLSSGTYTVTLTPADTTVKASSVTFEAKSATKANTIEIVGDYLVMKNTDFDEGYCFIKGYNEFEEEVVLSGITVNVAPSDSATYDSTTGKVTVKYANPGYAVVRNVSVFAQYTGADGQILTTQKTLEVSTIGYPSDVEFGEVKKEGGNAREDGLITIAELGSNKYYVELDKVQDQYGNDLSAEDLNDLVTDRLLTVIPSDAAPIFFGTNAAPFSTKEGKVVVFLTPGNGMPGTGALMITGAGGSFNDEIVISDDPFIDTLSMDIPDIYEGETTEEFAFTAVDQYGDEINLYDFAPRAVGNTLIFGDANHLTNVATTITASDAGVWKVKKDTVKKTFTVTYTPAAAAKSMITFTTITAGMNTTVQSVTVGGVGSAASIAPQGSSIQLDRSTTSKKLVDVLTFKDANGKTMDRNDCSVNYPLFLNDAGLDTDEDIDEENYTGYYWVVTDKKLLTDSVGDGLATALPVGAIMDADGKIETGNQAEPSDGTGANDDTTQNAAGSLYANWGNPTPSYYVTLLATDGANYKVLNTQSFRFTYAPANLAADVKYSVSAPSGTLYAKKGSGHSVSITVKATNTAGESWSVPAAGITLTPSAPFTSTTNKVNGALTTDFPDNTTSTVSVKVYAYGEAVDTVDVAYSNVAPVATSTSVKLTTTQNGSNHTQAEARDISTTLTDFTTALAAGVEAGAANSVASMTDGVFTITNVNDWEDTLTAEIKDQYGQTMKTSTVKLDGTAIAAAAPAIAAGGVEGNFVMTNGTQKIDLTITTGSYALNTLATVTNSDEVEVMTGTELVNALVAAAASASLDTIVVKGAITEVPADITIAAGDTLVIPHGYTVTTTNDVTNNGTIRGEEDADGNVTAATSGTLTIRGTAINNQAQLAGTGTVNLPGNTLVLENVEISGAQELIGHVTVSGSLTVTGTLTFDDTDEGNNTVVEIADATDLAGMENVATTNAGITYDGTEVADLEELEAQQGVEEDATTIGGATLAISVANDATVDAVKSAIANEVNKIDGLNYTDYAVTAITGFTVGTSGYQNVTVTLQSEEEAKTDISNVSVTVTVANA